MGELAKHADAGDGQRLAVENYTEIKPTGDMSEESAKSYWENMFNPEKNSDESSLAEAGKSESVIEKVEADDTGDIAKTFDASEISEEKIISDAYGRSEGAFHFDFDAQSPDVQKVLEGFGESSWDVLNAEEKRERVGQFVDVLAEKLGLENTPKVIYYTAPPDDCGEYRPKPNVIKINQTNLDNPKEIMDTVAHEMRHAYQYQRAQKMENYQDFLYAYNFENYISPIFFLDYEDQLVEAEARSFADLFAEK